MNQKIKLICFIFSFVLIFSISAFCVYAVTNLTFSMGGTVLFDALGVNATISLDSISGMELLNEDKAYKLKDVYITTTMTEEEITQQTSYSSWSNLAFQLGDSGEGILTFRVENTTDNVKEIINAEVSVQGATQNLQITASENQTIKLGETKTFSILFKVSTTNVDLPETPFSVKVKLNLAEVADATSVSYSVKNNNATLSQANVIPDDGIYVVPEYVVDENNNVYPVTKIGDSVYKNNTKLKSVVVPDTVTTIGIDSFYGCVNLESVVLSDNITSIQNRAFMGCVKLTAIRLPSKLRSLYLNAFSGTNIVDIEFTTTSISLGANALGEKWLEAQPDGEVIIGSYLYKYKGVLTGHYDVPTNVRTIIASAFENQTELTSVSIGNNVTGIASRVFYGCTKLETINFPTTNFSVAENVFNGTAWYNNHPNGVIYINDMAYTYKGTLPEDRIITIKDGTKKIAAGFTGFRNITVVLPNSVTHIYGYAFNGCKGLNIVVPASVKNIGNRAFFNTDVDITIMATTPPTLQSIDAFLKSNDEYATVYVPAGAKDAYMAAENWKDLNIVELPQ